MKLGTRRLLANGKGKLQVTAGMGPVTSAQKRETAGLALLSRPDTSDPDDAIETAAGAYPSGGPANSHVNEIVTRAFIGDVLDEFLPTHTNVAEGNDLLYDLYRDIYYHDSISGSAVDMYANLPFSDFTLTGLNEERALRAFDTALNAMNARRLLPNLSVNLQVNGMFPAEMRWDEDKKTFTGISIHDAKYAVIEPQAEFGRDPKVSINLQKAYAEMRQKTPAQKGLHSISPDNLIYIIRRGLFADVRGVSYFKRVLPVWLFEKALIRGTLDQATKRLRGIPHVQLGEEDWVPSPSDMQAISDLISNAMLDPVNAVLVTRTGINISDFMRGEDFWKWPDVYDFASQVKLRALGVNEAIITGDATLNTLEASMTVFIEGLREHRDGVTQELFYDRMFPRISVANDVTRNRYQHKSSLEEASAGDLVLELADEEKIYDSRKYMMPVVEWHKRLRPEADDAYLNVLNTLKEAGVPLPIQVLAAAGGFNVNKLLDSLDQDIDIRKKIAKYNEKVKEFAPKPEEGEGGDEFASVQEDGGLLVPKNFLSRDFSGFEHYDIQNVNGKGEKVPLSAKGKAHLTEKMHKRIAEAASRVAQQQNAKETAEEAASRELHGHTKTYSYPKDQ